MKKWNSWFLRCEGWKGLQMSPNEYHENLGARKFWVRRVLHMAKIGGARRHRWLRLGGEFCEKMKLVIFEIWGLERPTNVPKWIPWNSWCTKVLSLEGLSLGQVGWCIVAMPYGLGWVLWKNEIRGFWDVRVEKAYKYPQMNTMKFLVHESFEFGGVCTWLGCRCTTHSLITWWGVLWQNEIRNFWDVRVGKVYKCPQMNTLKILVHESFEFGGFCTWPSWRCTTA